LRAFHVSLMLADMTPWRDRISSAVLREAEHVSRLRGLLDLWLRALYHTAHKGWEDLVTLRAATLSFFTMLYLFPLTALFLFIVSHSVLFKEHVAEIQSALIRQLMTPAARQVVMDLFDSISKNLGLLGSGVSGAIAVLVLLLLGSSLILLVEKALNEIWRSQKRTGSVLSRVSLLWMGVTLLPILVGLSFALTAKIRKEWFKTFLLLHYGIPYLLTLTAFFCLYRFVPRARVQTRPALAAALLAALFWEVAKVALSRYVELVFSRSTVGKVYGSVAILPIGMIWIYYSWIIVLVGAELAYVLQHMELLQMEARRRSALAQGFVPLSRQISLALLLEILRAFEEGKAPLDGDDLIRRYCVHPDQARTWFASLERAGLLGRTEDDGLLPARPAAMVTVAEVGRLYGQTFMAGLKERCPPSKEWIEREEAAFDTSLGRIRLAEFLREPTLQEPSPAPPEAASP